MARTGKKENRSTTTEVIRKARIGLASALAIAPKTSTANVTSMAVSRIGKNQPSGA
jgi:hypothetical protein